MLQLLQAESFRSALRNEGHVDFSGSDQYSVMDRFAAEVSSKLVAQWASANASSIPVLKPKMESIPST